VHTGFAEQCNLGFVAVGLGIDQRGGVPHFLAGRRRLPNDQRRHRFRIRSSCILGYEKLLGSAYFAQV